jgi:hypothetical protein
MAFEQSRFLGISPRTILLALVAGGVVVGLFFIPETVKYLFDPKAKPLKERIAFAPKQPAQAAKRSPDVSNGRAALAPEALRSLNSDMQPKDKVAEPKKPTPNKVARKVADNDDAKPQGGLFSDWNFKVRARDSGDAPRGVPDDLNIDRISSKEAAAFFKASQGAMVKFLKSEPSLDQGASEAVAPFIREAAAVASGSLLKGEKVDESVARLRSAHIATLKGLKSAGGDRGVLMRWLQIPAVQFIDQQGGGNIGRRLRSSFAPALYLTDLNVRQTRRVRWSGDARLPTTANFELSVRGTDISRLVVYSNGKVVRSVNNLRRGQNQQRPLRFNGDAYGVWTVVAHDSFGAKPFSKSYSFYPRASVFRQSRNGEYEIGFLPGSARNSLDKFFFIGESGRGSARDGMISRF